MVPLLVSAGGLRQRQAHAVSLGAVVLLALAAAITYGAAGEVRLGTAAALFVGGAAEVRRWARGCFPGGDDRFARRAFGIMLVGTSAYLLLT